MKRLAFIGPPGSGKTLLAVEAASYYGGQKISFADALRREVADALGVNINLFTSVPHKYKYRALLQAWGVVRRDENENYWSRKVRNVLETWLDHKIITYTNDDCRFPNEYGLLRDWEFTFVRLAPSPHKSILTIKESELSHESEAHIDIFDVDFELPWVEGVKARLMKLEELMNE